PTWRADGGALVVSAAHDEETFNLVEVAADGSACRVLTHTTGGALWPDVSPDGSTIAFAGYTVPRYDIFTMPYPPHSQELPRSPPRWCQTRVRLVPGTGDGSRQAERIEPRGYNPLTTLAPTWWSPVIRTDADQVRAGASVNGADVLGYHRYTVEATWLASGPDAAIA